MRTGTGAQTAPRTAPSPQRNTCLLIAALCLLASLAGVVTTATDVGHHHRAHIVVALTSGTDVHGYTARSGPDIAPSDATAARDLLVVNAHANDSTQSHTTTAVDTLRTRGPPTAAS